MCCLARTSASNASVSYRTEDRYRCSSSEVSCTRKYTRMGAPGRDALCVSISRMNAASGSYTTTNEGRDAASAPPRSVRLVTYTPRDAKYASTSVSSSSESSPCAVGRANVSPTMRTSSSESAAASAAAFAAFPVFLFLAAGEGGPAGSRSPTACLWPAFAAAAAAGADASRARRDASRASAFAAAATAARSATEPPPARPAAGLAGARARPPPPPPPVFGATLSSPIIAARMRSMRLSGFAAFAFPGALALDDAARPPPFPPRPPRPPRDRSRAAPPAVPAARWRSR